MRTVLVSDTFAYSFLVRRPYPSWEPFWKNYRDRAIITPEYGLLYIAAALQQNGIDFGKEIIPQALGKYSVNAFLHRGYWADVGTIGAYYDANLMLTRSDAPFRFHDPKRPIFTHPRQLPPARLRDCTVRDSTISEGSSLDRCTITESVVGVRMVVRHAPWASAVAVASALQKATVTVLPGAAVPQTGAAVSCCRMPWSVNSGCRKGAGSAATNGAQERPTQAIIRNGERSGSMR